MSDVVWSPLPADAPFPERMQGTWLDGPDGAPVLVIEGRRVTFCGSELLVGNLSVHEEDGGALGVQNEGPPDNPRELLWSQRTLHLFWFLAGEDELNFHGIGDHGWAVRAPAREES